jgi:hypothetical protein
MHFRDRSEPIRSTSFRFMNGRLDRKHMLLLIGARSIVSQQTSFVDACQNKPRLEACVSYKVDASHPSGEMIERQPLSISHCNITTIL